MTDLREYLRTETAELHQRLEALPFFQALEAGHLPSVAIVSFLRSLAILHAVLERELSQVPGPALAGLVRHAFPKGPLLAADLDRLGGQSPPSIMPAIHSALATAAEVLTSAGSPLSLIGTLYVLEGSQRGGIILKKAYARCLAVDAEQLQYFGCYGKGTATHWQEFVRLLNELALDRDQAELVAQSAVRCFERLHALCTALYPFEARDLKHHVTTLNVEAGDHAIPQDPLEIALALRAGRNAWQKYPYLEQRFGERGKRFTSSDSCWLVTLARAPVGVTTKSLQWLRTVLASRGIPTVVLEGHLRAIQEALAKEFPDQIDTHTRYDRFLAGLEAERHGLGNGATLAPLVERYDRRLRACGGTTVESAAELIASAWTDERAGIDGAAAATRSWFTDAGRFSTDWIATVNELVASLDEAVGRSS